MKHLYLFFLLITTLGFAQIPSNYYDSANGLTEYALKTELKNIISNGHIDQGYGSLYTGYVTTHTDTEYENDGSILLYYTENPNGTDPYGYNHGSNNCGNYSAEGDCYNREHLVPQSAFSSANPMRTDIHHVIPSDGYANGQRGSYPFGTVSSASWTSQNGSKRGPSNVSGYSGTVFEPIDEFKGDIARAVLYFAVRYEDTMDNYGAFDMFNGTENQALEDWAITMLLDWHYNIDPVDQQEIDRNNAAYNYQGNANPFVDHPEYANLIWNPTTDTEAPTDPINLVASNPSDNTIDLNWTASTDNIAVDSYDVYMNGMYSFNVVSNTAIVTGLLPDTNYCFTVKAKDAVGNESGFSNQSCETTTNNGSAGGTDCLTETFENLGTSSGSYSNVTWTGDDGGTWNATDARTDQTLNTRAITIRNGTLTLPTTSGGIGSLTVTTQRVFSGGSGTFNLNVNGTLVGTIAYGDTQQTITIPNINVENNVSIVIDGNSETSNRVMFDDLSYTCYSSLSLGEFNIETIELYPNPVNHNLTVELKSNIDTTIEIFNMLGKQIVKNIINKTSTLNLEALNTGIYIVKITQGNSTITKKLVKE
ncbi:endonuclease [Winogradskyella endarachnes]|uniref:T9SS type A sorting domain-containing protein n=1 Tax=Winogradskyella endarachnes TaxID=2681965 RepID=A0A6L6U9N1_9FLAO|nr:endonuclease [Winogradskyella endarachnes]MUU78216.1 T9SS type A sorting domain-containing protein [Winogradskyella endarachnes]